MPALGEQYEMAGLSVFFTERSTMNAWLMSAMMSLAPL